MSHSYPAGINALVDQVDGPTEIIYADLINKIHLALTEIKTELGDAPKGSAADLQTRLAVMLANDGKLNQPQQLVTVGKTKSDYTSIHTAIHTIDDAAADKIYTVLVYPGVYTEDVELVSYVDIIAVNPYTTKIAGKLADPPAGAICKLRINIENPANAALTITKAGSDVTIYGDVSSSDDLAVNCPNGSLTIYGNISSTALYGLFVNGGNVTVTGNISSSAHWPVIFTGGSLSIHDSIITCTLDTDAGSGIYLTADTIVLRDVKILCTHADAYSICGPDPQDVCSMSVYTNRNDCPSTTQLIAAGFNFDTHVQ